MSSSNCPNCGALNEGTDRYCAYCGSALVVPSNGNQVQQAAVQNQNYGPNNNFYQNNQAYQNPNYQMNPNDLALFVGPNNTNYYMRKYTEMGTSNSKASWNWAAFWLAGPWMLYRKMYKYALIFFGALLLISLLLPYFSIVLSILSGIFGNHFYFKHAEEKLKSVPMMSDFEKNMFITGKGGTSVGAAIGLTFAYAFGISLIINLIYVATGYYY